MSSSGLIPTYLLRLGLFHHAIWSVLGGDHPQKLLFSFPEISQAAAVYKAAMSGHRDACYVVTCWRYRAAYVISCQCLWYL